LGRVYRQEYVTAQALNEAHQVMYLSKHRLVVTISLQIREHFGADRTANLHFKSP
jgi:hypothetical protein